MILKIIKPFDLLNKQKRLLTTCSVNEQVLIKEQPRT